MDDEDDRRCLVCGAVDTERWTLDQGVYAAVLDLCEKDAAPLKALTELAGNVPPWRQNKPARPEDAVKIPIRTRTPRIRGMEPLEWQPPS